MTVLTRRDMAKINKGAPIPKPRSTNITVAEDNEPKGDILRRTLSYSSVDGIFSGYVEAQERKSATEDSRVRMFNLGRISEQQALQRFKSGPATEHCAEISKLIQMNSR